MATPPFVGDVPPERLRQANRAMQGLIGLIFVAGLAVGHAGTVVNAALGLAVTFLPAALERDHRIHLSPGLVLFVTTAVFLHSLGMLGLYEGLPWWDHLTHVLSSVIVAGVGYSTARALDLHTDAISFPREFMFVYVLVFTMAFGVFWEVLEFAARGIGGWVGAEPVLVQYGIGDTMLDLVFDTFGALLFAIFGTRSWQGIVETLVQYLDRMYPNDPAN